MADSALRNEITWAAARVPQLPADRVKHAWDPPKWDGGLWSRVCARQPTDLSWDQLSKTTMLAPCPECSRLVRLRFGIPDPENTAA